MGGGRKRTFEKDGRTTGLIGGDPVLMVKGLLCSLRARFVSGAVCACVCFLLLCSSVCQVRADASRRPCSEHNETRAEGLSCQTRGSGSLSANQQLRLERFFTPVQFDCNEVSEEVMMMMMMDHCLCFHRLWEHTGEDDEDVLISLRLHLSVNSSSPEDGCCDGESRAKWNEMKAFVLSES